MSQYIEFFARKDDVFVPLYSESRNCPLYQLLEHFAPYGKIRELKLDSFSGFYNELERELELTNQSVDQYQKTMDLVAESFDPIGEKLDILNDLVAGLNETMESRSNLLRTRERLQFIEAMVDEADLNGSYKPAEHKWGIYCGIEVGADVTAADIVE